MASVFPKECGGVEGQLKGLNMYLVGRANGNSGFSLLFPFIFTLVSHFICCLLSSTRFPAACCCLPCALLNQINQVLARLPPLGGCFTELSRSNGCGGLFALSLLSLSLVTRSAVKACPISMACEGCPLCYIYSHLPTYIHPTSFHHTRVCSRRRMCAI